MKYIHCEQKDALYSIRFVSSPLPVLSKECIIEINHALQEFESNHNFRVLIITGTGSHFCVGANVKELRQETHESVAENDCIQAWQMLSTLSKPVIAAVNGAALGGGFEYALMADIIFASEHAFFGFPEIKLGLMPGGGGTQRILQRIGLSRSLDLLFTGDSITAQHAMEWGIVNRIVQHDHLMTEVFRYAEKLCTFSKDSLVSIKKSVTYSSDILLRDSLDQERQAFYRLLFSANGQEGISAFLEKRPPSFY
jgi:enoyl-CoA hydratase